LAQPAEQDRPCLGDAVAIGIPQQRDAIGTFVAVLGIVVLPLGPRLGRKNVPVWKHQHVARRV
jgi:hypothetical protein